MKYIAKIGAYDYPAGVEIFKRIHNYYNPDLVFFDWPNNKGGLWLEKHEYEEVKENESQEEEYEPYVPELAKNPRRKLKIDQYWSC